MTKARPSTFGTDVPATVHFSGGVVGAASSMTFTSFLPFVSWPKSNDTFASQPTTLPFSTLSAARLTFASSAARSSSSSRAAAATRRSRAAMSGVVRLPAVPKS